MAADWCGLGVAFLITELVFGSLSNSAPGQGLLPSGELALFVLTLPVWTLLAKLYGLYDRDGERVGHTTIDDLRGVFHLVTVGIWTVTLLQWSTGLISPDFAKLVFFWTAAISLIVLTRSAARAAVRRTTSYRQKTVIVGADRLARLVFEKLQRYSDSRLDIAGCVADGPNGGVDGLPVLGSPRELPSIVTKHGIERVVLAQLDEAEAPGIIRSLRSRDVQVDFVPRPLEAVGLSGTVQMLDGIPILGLTPVRLSRSSLWLKRTMDVVLSGIALLFLSPALAFIALRIKLDSPGPVFYRHDRIGRKGRAFRLLKFRTMQTKYCRGSDYGGEDAEREFERLMREPSLRSEFEANYKLQSDPRVTRLGDFLRRTSLDELPQLVNVFRGELSLVGPRPIVPDELSRYGSDSKTLLGLRPGVTGLWQVSGRSDTSYQERVRLDIAYVSNWSVPLDVLILAHTARTLLMSRDGAY